MTRYVPALLVALVATGAGSATTRVQLLPAEIAFWDGKRGVAILAPTRQLREGRRNAIGLTSDGGRTWRRVESGRFSAIAVAERRAAWAVGATGLLRSSDGGRTWHRVSRI